jgi:hypothetical protein
MKAQRIRRWSAAIVVSLGVAGIGAPAALAFPIDPDGNSGHTSYAQWYQLNKTEKLHALKVLKASIKNGKRR